MRKCDASIRNRILVVSGLSAAVAGGTRIISSGLIIQVFILSWCGKLCMKGPQFWHADGESDRKAV
jgi:hypothetical protein